MVYHIKYGEDIIDMIRSDMPIIIDYVNDIVTDAGLKPTNKTRAGLEACAETRTNKGLEICLVKNSKMLAQKPELMPDAERIKRFDKVLKDLDETVGMEYDGIYRTHEHSY